jgi:hypothetical protein
VHPDPRSQKAWRMLRAYHPGCPPGGSQWSVTAVAGNPDQWGGAAFADGSGKDARFAAQMGMGVDASGAVILADTANYRLRRIEPGPTWEQTRVFTLAGDGRFGTARGGGEVANVVSPAGVALGPDGRLYVSDPFHHQILEVTPTGAP